MNINFSPNKPSGILSANGHNSASKTNIAASRSARNLERFQSANLIVDDLSISERAQKMFAQMQKEGGDLTSRLQEFVEMETSSLIPPSFHDEVAALREAHSHEAWEFLRQAHFALGGTDGLEFFSLENAEMAEMGFQLLSSLGTNRNAVDNFTTLANKYSEMRNSLEATYSGEELKTQLGKLSEAFDLTTEILSFEHGRTAFMRMRIEQVRISAHNSMITQNTTQRFFDGGHIEYDEEKMNNTISSITSGIRESIRHFAQLARQFVLENGAISGEQGNEVLLSFLKNAPEPQNGFSFDNLNSINEALSRPFNNGDTPHPHVQRPVTMFTELWRIMA